MRIRDNGISLPKSETIMAKSNDIRETINGTYIDPSQLGLCSTCVHMDICVSKKTWKGPILFCEEFDDHVPSKPVREISNPAENVKDISLPAETNAAAERKGLCVNCLLRNTCAFPLVEGGIWHCEEYK